MAKGSKRRGARKAKAPPGGYSVDLRGRWRDDRGRFVSRRRLIDQTEGTSEEIGELLQKRVKAATRSRGRYIVAVRIAELDRGDRDPGWRHLSTVGGLQEALWQAGDRLANLNVELAYRQDEAFTVIDVEIVSEKEMIRRMREGAKKRRAKATRGGKRGKKRGKKR